MWNDTDIPLAVFFTFRCHGTWLHGDERSSVDRHNNVYGTPRIPANPNWQDHNSEQLLHDPVKLNASQRRSAERGVRDTCEKRDWQLLAINVRTNHVHAVISVGPASTRRALAALKANATREMRNARCWDLEQTPWAEKGSRRKLWNEKSVAEAIDYVINGQGDKLPDFDWW